MPPTREQYRASIWRYRCLACGYTSKGTLKLTASMGQYRHAEKHHGHNVVLFYRTPEGDVMHGDVCLIEDRPTDCLF